MTTKFLYNSVQKNDTDYNVWMAFPGCKAFAFSSLGYLCISKIFDEIPYVNFEMVFSDTDKTKIFSKDVDFISFSLSFDMDFLEVFKILEKYNIPLKSSKRDDSYPIICAGGPVLTANPEPYAEIFDVIVIGDGEKNSKEMIDICHEYKDKSKSEILKKISEIEGVYVPSLFQEKVRKSTNKLEKCICSTLLSDESFFANTYIIEVARGCSNRCAFCIASYLNLPIRFVDYDEIISKIEFGLEHTNKIALLGAMLGAHPRFDDICSYIYEKVKSGQNIELTVSSLRADLISPIVIKTLVACGQKNSTIAIEAASERLRKVINKNLSEEQIRNSIKMAQENGLKGLKIYSMIGLPTETQEDIDEFLRLAKDLKKEFKGFELSYAFSTFVPKPHTPFQWCAREATKSLEQKQKYLKKEFHKLGIDASFSSAKWDYYQTLLSRGGRELADYLIEVYKQGGKIGAFKSAYKEVSKQKFLPEIDFYTTRNYDLSEKLPWDFVEFKINKEFLVNEYKKLLNLE